jgi:transposase
MALTHEEIANMAGTSRETVTRLLNQFRRDQWITIKGASLTIVKPDQLDLESLAADVVALAMKAGASDAEAVAREGDEFSVNVRMGEVETLKESGSRGLGLRVFLGKRSARLRPAT